MNSTCLQQHHGEFHLLTTSWWFPFVYNLMVNSICLQQHHGEFHLFKTTSWWIPFVYNNIMVNSICLQQHHGEFHLFTTTSWWVPFVYNNIMVNFCAAYQSISIWDPIDPCVGLIKPYPRGYKFIIFNIIIIFTNFCKNEIFL